MTEPFPLPQRRSTRRDPDGLPASGSRVADRAGDVWTQCDDGLWRMKDDGRPGVTWDELNVRWGPLRLMTD